MNQQPSSLNCFVCGVENKFGLHIHFYETGPDEVTAEYTVPNQHQGYPGIVHGGIVATMLDEVSSRTVFRGDPPRLVVTARLALRYRKPVPVGVPLKLVGRLLEDKGHVCRVSGAVYGPDDALLAESDATLFEVASSFFEGFATLEDQGWKVYPENEDGEQREVAA